MRTTLNIIGFALLSGAAALPAAAAPDISEVLTMTSSVQYFTHDSPMEGETFDNVNTKELSFEGGNRRLGAQLDTRLGAGGNFFFLHNIYTQGQGFVEMITDLTIAITNNSASTAFLRLDSLITPGFIGFQGQNTDPEVQFLFHVRQFANHPTLGARTDLYQASGSLDHTGPQPNSIVTSDSRQFTGFSSYVSALGDRVAFEWGATPLSLALAPIAAGDTHYVHYYNFTRINIVNGFCATLLGCEGVQVAFGDPRNDGSSSPFSAAAFVDPGSFSGPTTNDQLLIGRRFNATNYSMADVVDIDAPAPPALPDPAPPATFDWLPPVDLTGAVPEPASWLMLISGFGLVGAMQRRQRPRTAARAA